jgi:hypothetical protein
MLGPVMIGSKIILIKNRKIGSAVMKSEKERV